MPADGSSPTASFVAATLSLLRPGSPPGISVTVPPAAAISARATVWAVPSCEGSTNIETAKASSSSSADGTSFCASSSAGSISTTSRSSPRAERSVPSAVTTVVAPRRWSSSATAWSVPISSGRPAAEATAARGSAVSSVAITAPSAEVNRVELRARAVSAPSPSGTTVDAGAVLTMSTVRPSSPKTQAPRPTTSAATAVTEADVRTKVARRPEVMLVRSGEGRVW